MLTSVPNYHLSHIAIFKLLVDTNLFTSIKNEDNPAAACLHFFNPIIHHKNKGLLVN
jgi:hypothetical protein